MKSSRSLLALSLSLAFAAAVNETSGGCTVCSDGSSVGLPDRVVSFPPLFAAPLTCGELSQELPTLLPPENPDCFTIQAIGSLCGCPSKANSCKLCKDGGRMHNPDNPLNFTLDYLTYEGAILQIAPTCETADAFLRTTEQQGSFFCRSGQAFLPDICQCAGYVDPDSSGRIPCSFCADGSKITLPDQTFSVEGFAFTTCANMEDAVAETIEAGTPKCIGASEISTHCGCPRKDNHCTLCPDGSSVSEPDKSLYFLKDYFRDFLPSCSMYEAYAHSLDNESEYCGLVQTSSSICGCASPIRDRCDAYGSQELTLQYRDVELDDEVRTMLNIPDEHQIVVNITCEFLSGLQHGLEKDDRRCHLLQSRSDICGTNEGRIAYGGAKIDREKTTLAWLPRVSGILSLIGAFAVIVDVVCSDKKRHQIYNQLMAAMSLFNLLSSAAWIFSTAANPTDDLWSVYGEQGSVTTCTFQAFFIQLALTALFYNVSLMVYYYLAIVRRPRARSLKQAVKYMHMFPAIGIIIALAGIPFYGSILLTCHLLVPPLMADSWHPAIWFQFVPVISSITICTLLTFLVVRTVYQRNSNTKRLPTLPSSIEKVEREVANQAVVYLVVVFISWASSLVFLLNLGARSYSLNCATLFLIPLQGFLNSANYFRFHFKRPEPQVGEQEGGKESSFDPEEISMTPRRGRHSARTAEDLSHDVEASYAFIFEPSAFLEQALADEEGPVIDPVNEETTEGKASAAATTD